MRWVAVIKAASHSEVHILVNRPSSSLSRLDSALRSGSTVHLGGQPCESSATLSLPIARDCWFVSQVHTVKGIQS
jgi:hypothetical protein